MTTISAKVIDCAVNNTGPEPKTIYTIRARYPRWIHAEGRTHRQLSDTEDEFDSWEPRTPSPMEDKNLSRNAASSRAIPVKKMIEAIRADPAVPLYWGANQRGMQAGQEIDVPVEVLKLFGTELRMEPLTNEKAWLHGMEQMIALAEAFDTAGYHKQIINRLLEPFMHIEVLFTATEWSNFFALRIHSAAEPHICLLATRMKEAMNKAVPRVLEPGEWYLPYVGPDDHAPTQTGLVRLSAARCAHLSYETVGTGEPIDLAQATRIISQLLPDGPDAVIHASPFEHQARADVWADPHPRYRFPYWLNDDEHGNLVGFRQYRKMLPGECR